MVKRGEKFIYAAVQCNASGVVTSACLGLTMENLSCIRSTIIENVSLSSQTEHITCTTYIFEDLLDSASKNITKAPLRKIYKMKRRLRNNFKSCSVGTILLLDVA